MSITSMRTDRRVLPDGRPAPQLRIMFVCPSCHRPSIRDVYAGVQCCGHCRGEPFLVAERIVNQQAGRR